MGGGAGVGGGGSRHVPIRKLDDQLPLTIASATATGRSWEWKAEGIAPLFRPCGQTLWLAAEPWVRRGGRCWRPFLRHLPLPFSALVPGTVATTRKGPQGPPGPVWGGGGGCDPNLYDSR